MTAVTYILINTCWRIRLHNPNKVDQAESGGLQALDLGTRASWLSRKTYEQILAGLRE